MDDLLKKDQVIPGDGAPWHPDCGEICSPPAKVTVKSVGEPDLTQPALTSR